MEKTADEAQYHLPPIENDHAHEYALPPQDHAPEIADQIVTGIYFNVITTTVAIMLRSLPNI